MNSPHKPNAFFNRWLFVIAVVALIARLKNLGSESMTADELSALLRLQFSSIGEMLEKGVRPDGHPAFVQVLLWFWTKLFGDGEFVARLPFALAGTGAVIYLARIGRAWFGVLAGLFAAAALALLEFPIMYSQLARPYAFGLLFGLAAVYHWTVFFQSEKPARKTIIAYALYTALAMYTHYFSFLLVVLVGITGLLLLKKHNWKMYLSGGVLAVLLWLPHLGFSLTQIQTGGVGGPGGWLGAPTPDFIGQHFYTVFNHSWKLVGLMALIGLLGNILCRNLRWTKFHLIALLWFALPFAIGYVYSVMRNPVLQHSVLLFSVPFLLLFIFSGWTTLIRPYASSTALLLFISGLFVHSFILREYHLTNYFGRLRELVDVKLAYQKKDNLSAAYFNVDAPYFLEYYEKKLGQKMTNVLGTINNGFGELHDLRRAVDRAEGHYFIYGWSTRFSPGEAENIIREKFPRCVEQKRWFNSAVYVFSDDTTSAVEKDNPRFETQTDFLKPVSGWTTTLPELIFQPQVLIKPFDCLTCDDILVPNGNPYLKLDSLHPYSPMFTSALGKLITNPDQEIEVVVSPSNYDLKNNASIVIQVKRGDSLMYWNGMESRYQYDSLSNNNHPWYFRTRLPEHLRQSDELNVFVWCMKGEMLIARVYVRAWNGHTGIYGPRPNYAP